MQKLIFKEIGILDYNKAWNFQNKLFQKIIDIKLKNRVASIQKQTPNYFLFTEQLSESIYYYGRGYNVITLDEYTEIKNWLAYIVAYD